jgi:hypothetical protein
MIGAFASCLRLWRAERENLLSGSVIIRFLASKSLSFMLFGVPSLNRILISLAVLAAACATISCGSNKSTSPVRSSRLRFRAFVSNPLLSNGGSIQPVLNIVDALQDQLSPSVISLASGSTQPGMMVLSPDLGFTLVYSSVGNTVVVVDNTTESIAPVAGSSTPLPAINLPGLTESITIDQFNTTAYAAVPTAAVIGQSPGAVVVMNLQNGSISATIPVPGAHFLVPSPDGSRILVFSDNSDTVTTITPILIGTHTDPRGYIAGFDRPVWGVFNGSGTAYILNCGLPCGGTAAGVSVLDIPSSTITSTTPVSAARYGLLNDTTLYVAGTPPGTNTCTGTRTAAATCGRLSILDTGSMAVKATEVITDGRQNRMQISSDGQLFIGAHGCTNINIPGGEVRGCLSIFNSIASTVVIPPQQGDATGIQPITGRQVVYVCQNGSLAIYDTSTDKLQVSSNNSLNNYGQVNIVGDAVDVKLVD